MNEISDEGPILGSGWIPMMASVLLLVGLFVGYKVLRTDVRVGAAIMVGSAVPAAIVALRFIRIRRALGTATLEMKDDVVPLGWSGTVTYARPLRGATVRSIEARLQCKEHVEKGSGRSHREWRQVVVDQPLSPQTAPYLEQVRVQIPVKIPARTEMAPISIVVPYSGKSKTLPAGKYGVTASDGKSTLAQGSGPLL